MFFIDKGHKVVSISFNDLVGHNLSQDDTQIVNLWVTPCWAPAVLDTARLHNPYPSL